MESKKTYGRNQRRGEAVNRDRRYRVDKCYHELAEEVVSEYATSFREARKYAREYAADAWIARIYQDGKLVETWQRRKAVVYRIKAIATAVCEYGGTGGH